MKKLTVVIALVLFLVPSFAMAAVSVQPGQYRATTNLNVRYLPRVGSARINHLHKGDTVTVKRVVKGWCEIELKRYRQAWVKCDFLESAGIGSVTAVSQNQPSTYADYNGVKVGKTDSGNWTLGNPDAKVTMEEFGDMECPFCAKYSGSAFQEIFRNYIATGKVKYVFYNFPLSFHTDARGMAMVTLCAGDQDKFWKMHEVITDVVRSDGDTSAMAKFKEFISNGEIDIDAIKACATSEKYGAQIDQDIALGGKKNVQGTPAFFINGKMIEGAQPYDVYQKAIESALEE